MEEQHEAATGKAENLNDPTALNQQKQDESGAGPAYPNKANNSQGAGSPYGGTQTADGAAPDGNQQIHKGAQEETPDKATLPESAGDEYGSQSSYGDPGDDKAGDGAETDAAGTPVH